MTIELELLGWTMLLALVHLMLPAHFRNVETGIAYNAGPRDEAGPPVGRMTGRLRRAQQNFYETFPLFAAAVLIAHVAGRESSLTAWGAAVYLAGRLVYLPLYAFGVPYWRSAAWGLSMLGLVLLLIAILRPL